MRNGRVSAFKEEEALICIHVKCEILSKNIADRYLVPNILLVFSSI